MTPRNRKRINRCVKERIHRKFRGRCAFCGATRDLTIDHVVPLARGGRNIARNMQILCVDCNRAKRSKIMFSVEDIKIVRIESAALARQRREGVQRGY